VDIQDSFFSVPGDRRLKLFASNVWNKLGHEFGFLFSLLNVLSMEHKMKRKLHSILALVNYTLAKFEVRTPVLVKVAAFWDMVLCKLVYK
jgi:hypothetical protein